MGRWSQQKGIDLIADVFFSILEEYPRTQLICVGPVIDLYGKFAALKLAKMMEKYPTRVCSKPVFTQLPPYIFSGAEFALIPSRDEPFGLVAVEFGRKGALGVGSRVGGLGNMPGWWFTVESITTKHLLGQLKSAIRSALASSKEVRAVMRNRSALQRFPVAQWVEDLETLQATSIQTHKKYASRQSGFFGLQRRSSIPTTELPPSSILTQSNPGSGISTAMNTAPNTAPNSVPPSIHEGRVFHPGFGGQEYQNVAMHQFNSPLMTPANTSPNSPTIMSPANTVPNTPVTEATENPFDRTPIMSRSASLLSLHAVAGHQSTYGLQKVDPNFTDSGSVYFNSFERMLNGINGKTSEDKFCIEKYLTQSEKRWFAQRHRAKLGRLSSSTPTSSVFRMPMSTGGRSNDGDSIRQGSITTSTGNEDFLLGDDYVPPTGIKKFFQTKVGDWPIYTFLLAFVSIDQTAVLSCLLIPYRAKSLPRTLTKLLFSLVRMASLLTSFIQLPAYILVHPYAGGSSIADWLLSMYYHYHFFSTALHFSCSAWRLMLAVKEVVDGCSMSLPVYTVSLQLLVPFTLH